MERGSRKRWVPPLAAGPGGPRGRMQYRNIRSTEQYPQYPQYPQYRKSETERGKEQTPSGSPGRGGFRSGTAETPERKVVPGHAFAIPASPPPRADRRNR
ncbi:hypothetical protein GCM10010284_64590 [Streptomyces rubiginosohelvolus]|nr:hypothetical protein GCM10010284_64590 [Streptomyces rubiginosohelvolus]